MTLVRKNILSATDLTQKSRTNGGTFIASLESLMNNPRFQRSYRKVSPAAASTSRYNNNSSGTINLVVLPTSFANS